MDLEGVEDELGYSCACGCECECYCDEVSGPADCGVVCC